MTNTEAIVRGFVQKAHDRGGGLQMAMLMMAERLLLLEDALACARIAAGPDPFGEIPARAKPHEA